MSRTLQTIAFFVATASVLMTGQVHAAGLLIADGGFGGVLEIKDHDVRVTINNGIAVTEVEQSFLNTENRQVEALYTFPVPRGASVANFSMWIGGKEMIGEVIEKQRARQIYDSYKQQRRDPGLLEQIDYKTFEMRIFPIGPRAEQKVRITYYQELDYDHDWGTYVYPLATVSQASVSPRVTDKFAFSLDVRSAVPIVAMESPSHPDAFVTAQHRDDYWQASLETHGGDLGRDIVIAFKTARPITGLDLIASKQPQEDGFFLLTLTAGEELAAANDGADYVFILDVSGSMAHDGKLRLSRNSLDAFIEQLGQGDRFEVITFNVRPQTLFGQLTAVDGNAKTRAAQFLASREARGGTALPPAITAAYRYGDPDRALNVVILSDGMTEQRERRELIGLMKQRPAQARVFCIGVGNEVNRPLLTQLAEDAGGLASFISHGDDFDRQARAFRRKLMHPAVTDLNIAFGGGAVYDAEPATLPNLYHGAPIRVFGRYRNGGPVEVRVTGEVQGRSFTRSAQLDLPQADLTNPQIERMWAWHRIDAMLKEGDRNGSRPAVVDQVVRLGEAYSIATEYTSFIVLENDGEYQRWKIERRNALRVGRDRAGQEQLEEALAKLRRQAAESLAPVNVAPRPMEAQGQPAGLDRPAANRPAPSDPIPGSRRGLDLNLGGGGGGGGALDPLSAAVALGLGGLGVFARRKRPRR